MLIFVSSLTAYSQHYIEDVRVSNSENDIQLNISTNGPVNHEVLGFDSKEYTVLRITPLTLSQENKQVLMASFENLDVGFQALELNNNTVMLAFKNLRPDRLSVQKSKERNILNISVEKKSIKESGSQKSNIQLAQEILQNGEKHFGNEDYPAAISDVRAALRLQPNYAEAYFLGGQIRFEMEDWDKARFNFQKASELRDNYDQAKKYLAKIETITEEKNEPIEQQEDTKSIHSEEFIAESIIDSTQRDSAIDVVESELPGLAENDSSETSKVNNVPEPITEAKIDTTVTSDSVITAIYKPFASQLVAPRTSNYIQLVFFLTIISCLSGWIIYLFRKRGLLMGKKQEKIIEDFSSTLTRLQKDMHTEPPKKRSQVDQSKQKSEKSLNKINSEMKNTGESFSLRDQHRERNFDPLPFDGDPTDKVHQYASVGYSVEEIARMLSLGKGEVELILNFGRRYSPKTKPELAFNLE